jgi:adenylosuccinate synthase
MPVTVVVGGQFGSEGKGKICAFLGLTDGVEYMVRCGGPNSGHTVELSGSRYQLRQVPSGFANPCTRLLIAAGALVDPRVFLREVELCGLTPERIGIDRNAGVIEGGDGIHEHELDLQKRLGSTGVGVGSAVARRVLREPDFRQAADHPDLQPFVTSVSDELSAGVRAGKSVVVEGTQGYGLSLYHADEWPFRTSRDTTAHSFLGEVGLGTRNHEVILAIRTYPIRVSGNSGPLPNEISWDDVQRESRTPHQIAEFTTTTKKLRRVARFDWSVVERAVVGNDPTQIALHGVDYIDYENRGATDWDALSGRTQAFIGELEAKLQVPVTIVGTGPDNEHTVDRRQAVQGSRDWQAGDDVTRLVGVA